MRSIVGKLWKVVTNAQVLAVVIAFALMVIFSYYFMSNIERRHLLKDVNNAIANTQAHIEADLLEPSTALSVISENIRTMIINGVSMNIVQNYMRDILKYLTSDDQQMSYTTDVFGFFPVFDGAILYGLDNLSLDDLIPYDRPWYKAAVEADGKVGVTQPYINRAVNRTSLTFARQIFDDDNNVLGIVCLNIMLDRIRDYAVNTFVTNDSYGILLDSQFNVLAHPYSAFLGINVSLMNDGEAILNELMQGNNISERKAWDYNNKESVLFVQRLNNGWYLAIIAYTDNYYQSVREIGRLLIIMGLVLASGLCAILLSIVFGKKRVEERTTMMLDAAPLGVTMWDRDYNLIDFNYEAARVVGIYSKQEYRERFMETAPEYQPDGMKTFDKLVQLQSKAFNEGKSQTIWYHNHVNGEAIPFDAKSVSIRHKNNPFVITYCQDLREYYAILAKTREAEERIQVMLDTTPLVIGFWNKDFEIIDCSHEAVKLFELSDKKEYLERIHEFSPEYQPDGRLSSEKFIENITKVFNDGYSRFEWLHRKLNGELIQCDVELIRVKYRDEYMVCGYTRDLREMKSIMAKIREADECTQIMFDATPLSCFMIDNKLNLVDCNQEIVRLFGLSSKKEFIDRIFEFFPQYQPSGEESRRLIFKYVNEAFEEGNCRFEWIHQKADGELIPTEVSFVRVKFKGEYAVAGYVRDLRELKAMIAEMRRAEVAEESSKAKSDFLAKMSHEIRTPMNAILGITEIQLQDKSLSLGNREALERIYNSGDLLLGIINDILDLSKIEASKLELSNSQYDIPSLVHDIVKLNIIRYESKPIEFKLDVNENIPSLLIGDELRIKQILNNLLSNAFKYTQEGQIELSLFSEPVANSSSVILVFRVSDTGQGMTVEQVKRLGEKFYRFNLEANRKTEGTGLGMNITRNLIQLMKGDISIESTPGMGSTFTVRLPQECADNTPVGRELADNLMTLNLKSTTKTRNLQTKQEYMPYGSVLVVDDVETNLYVARGLLTPYGLKIDTALSGFEAVDKIRDNASYDIIFMDHMMPRMDGIEAAKLIRSLGYSKPIVALTANAIFGQEEIFLKNGFDDFISKPIDIRQLNSVLNRLIRDKQPADTLEEARKQKNTLYAAGGHKIAIEPQLAEIFGRDAKKALAVFENICENKFRRSDDVPVFIINIHSMKSVLMNIGENGLSAEAEKLEQAGRDNKTQLILSALPDFIKSLGSIIEKHNPNEDSTETENNAVTAKNSLILQEKLLAIQDACASMDKKSAKDALAYLKEMAWSKEIREKLSAISESLLHSEFEEAAGIARSLLS